MSPKPRRPRVHSEPLSPVTFSVAEYCAMTGLSRATVTRLMDDGILRTVKVGFRRLILAKKISSGMARPVHGSALRRKAEPRRARTRRGGQIGSGDENQNRTLFRPPLKAAVFRPWLVQQPIAPTAWHDEPDLWSRSFRPIAVDRAQCFRGACNAPL